MTDEDELNAVHQALKIANAQIEADIQRYGRNTVVVRDGYILTLSPNGDVLTSEYRPDLLPIPVINQTIKLF